jgi:predicted amidohydrolase YtcJ
MNQVDAPAHAGSFDQIFVGGNVLTMHTPQRAEAVAVATGKVVAVGTERELRSQASSFTEIVDLEGRTLLPGFEDVHAHVWKMGHLLTTSLDLRRSGSIEAIGDLVRERSAILPQGSWLQGRGFNEISLAERRRPTRHDLDRFAPDRPVVLTRTCGHIFVANSVALRLAGIDSATVAPDGGVIERELDGKPNGLLHETAIGLVHRVLPPPTRADYKQMIHAALRHQLSLGITSSSDCGVLPNLLEAYLEMDLDGTLPARITVMPLGRPDGSSGPLVLPSKHHSPMLRIDTVKFLADGGLSGATAALSIPYRNSTSTGVVRFQSHELSELFADAHRQGWRIATHAIGDAAIEQVVGLYERLGPHPSGLTHRIEHAGLPSASQLKRMAAAGISVATQAIFLDELGANFLAFVPDGLGDRIYPFRDMLEAGVTVAFSSDAPVVESDSPLAGMHAALARRTRNGVAILPDQTISVEDGLRAYTVSAAITAGEEQSRGSIQPGRWADFAVLSADPTAVETEAIRDISVERTYLGGKLVYEKRT